MRIRYLAALTAALALSVPAVANAATRTVYSGLPEADAKRFQERYGVEMQQFFPSRTAIHRGDSVRFPAMGFHNVEFPKRGDRPAPLIAPTGIASGVNDEAGSPFWFNGQPTIGFNPVMLESGWGKSFTHTGRKTINSGLPLGDDLKPMEVKFTRLGTFSFFCAVHPGMKGSVQVKRENTSIPSKRDGRKALARQIRRAENVAKKLASKPVPPNTVLLGVAGAQGAERLAMQPVSLDVAVGTTVEFKMDANSRELHTASFGPGADNIETQPESYLGTLSASFFTPSFDPRATYPSELPGTVASYSSSLHGNGFWNSGGLDTDPRTAAPATSQVTFGQAGVFPFACVIHPFMRGTINSS